MNRRNFLRSTGALSLPAILSSGLSADPSAFFTRFLNPDSDKVLVLIRLSGGNDGLNTLIGLDQLDNLTQVRSNVAIAANQALTLTPTVGLHGKMMGMKDLYDNGQLGVVQAVGYPNQNRSHFRSTDIWTSGSAADESLTTGWLGRYLELEHPEFPNGYPNEEFDYPLAMTMGNVVSSTCQGTSSNLSVVVNNPFNFLFIAPGGNTALPENFYGKEVNYVRNLIGQSNQYGTVVQNAATSGNSLATTYTDGRLSDQLQNIATLISGGLKTKIYVATIGSFDTHSGQVDTDDPLNGNHGELLEELSASINAFMDDLHQLGVADRVMGLTFSEFGRRIRSNQSNGTDHGDAGPLFLFGNCVQPGVLGINPEIDTQVEQNVGVPFQYDFRDVYGSVLVDWFEVPEATVQTLFTGGFTYLPVANACNSTLAVVSEIAAVPYEDVIDILWFTFPGQGRQGFSVERSTDGRNFRSIATIPPNEDVNNDNYQFKDSNVRRNVLYYYRVMAKDTDGNLNASSVKTARLRGSSIADWAVGLPRPNPVQPESYVKVYAPTDAMAEVEILDITGRSLRRANISLLGGRDNRVPLRPENLPSGTYVWRLTTRDGERFARKFIK